MSKPNFPIPETKMETGVTTTRAGKITSIACNGRSGNAGLRLPRSSC